MKSTLKKGKGSVVEGEVTLNPEEFLKHWESAFGAHAKHVRVPGFRTGTAPREIAAKHIDSDNVFRDAADSAVKESLEDVLRENDWKIIDGPSVEVLEASPKGDKKTDKGFVYKAKFVVFPEVKLGNYKKIAEKILSEEKPISIPDADITKTLEWLQGSRATIVAVNREAKKGDLIELDIESFQGDTPIPGGKLSHDRFVLGESQLIPGFDEQLIGALPQSSKTFTLIAPADYYEASLRGKEVKFVVKVRSVSDRILPALDDAFASALGKEFKTVDQVKKSIRDGLEEEAKTRARDKARAKMLEAIGQDARIDIPPVMTERVLEELVTETAHLTKQSQTDADRVKLREALTEKAKSRVRGYLVIHEIADKEGLEPTEEEIRVEMAKTHVDPKSAYDYSYGIVRNRKVFEFLEKK
jgi:trigger factor